MSTTEDEADDQLATTAPTVSPRFFKLPDFWTASPLAWFRVSEAQSLLRSNTKEPFALVTAVLPEASACRVAHILVAPGNKCYDDLRDALLVAHQLTAFQKAEKHFSSEPLGGGRPSELLCKMLELVYPGKERSHLFAMLFLRPFPLQSACSSPRMTTRTSAPWPTRLTGAPPLSFAISSSYQFLPPPPTTLRTVRSSMTSPLLLWAPTGVAASPTGPEAARTTPKAAEAASILSTAASPPSRSPAGKAGWSLLQPLHLRQQDLQLQWQLLLVWKLGSPGGVNAVRLGHLVFLKDHTTGALFLADTGASVSLVSGTASQQGRLLTVANGAAIATGPVRSLTPRLKDSQSAMHQCNFTFITGGCGGAHPGHQLPQDVPHDCGPGGSLCLTL